MKITIEPTGVNTEFERELLEVTPERQLVSFDYRLVL